MHIDESDACHGDVQVSFEEMYVAMTKIEQAIFTDKQFERIQNREFKRPTRHHDYLDKAMSLKLAESGLSAISKIDQLKALMNP